MNPSRKYLQRLTPMLKSLRTTPEAAGQPFRPRYFNSKTPLLILTRSPTRPNTSLLARSHQISPRGSRQISTDKIAHIKYQIKLGLYWVVLSWTVVGSGFVAYLFLRQDWLDKQFPSPEEWQLPIKIAWRKLKYEEQTAGPELGLIDWGLVATHYRLVMKMLEDYKFFWSQTPSGILAQNDWDRSIPGTSEEVMRSPPENPELSRIGHDVSMKSESWRRGYFEAMLGACIGAEHQHGLLTHIPSGMNFPPHQVRSERNPYPVPFPKGFPITDVDEKDCQPAFESPDFHYLRLLTTTGFSRKQRIQAGIHYAGWLDASQKPELAEQMYRWSLNLATEGLPDTDKFVNTKSGVLDKAAPYTTKNLLDVTTALASHYARHEKIPQALNIYLSVLRARRASPEAIAQYAPRTPDYSLKSVDSFLIYLGSLLRTGQYGKDTITGDESFERNKTTACEEAAVMTYVGEILFARANKRSEGLSWTRDAARIAEDGHEDARLDRKSKEVCTQCFTASLTNWQNMIGVLASEKQSAAPKKKSGWLWSSSDDKLAEEADWAEEERLVKRKKQTFDEEVLNKRLNAMISHHSKTFAI